MRWGIRRALHLGGYVSLGAGTVLGVMPLLGIVGYLEEVAILPLNMP